MTEDLLERLARIPGAEGPPAPRVSLEVRSEGRFSPDELEVSPGWTVIEQGPGDLGERLARAARTARRDGIRRQVMVGADAPLLPLSLVEAAFSRLSDWDALLAPAEDGGYVLIGLALERVTEIAVEHLFRDIPWGTGAVREATAAAAEGAGLRFGELSHHWDVDRPEDLLRLRASIEALDPGERPRRTVAVLTAAGH